MVPGEHDLRKLWDPKCAGGAEVACQEASAQAMVPSQGRVSESGPK